MIFPEFCENTISETHLYQLLAYTILHLTFSLTKCKFSMISGSLLKQFGINYLQCLKQKDEKINDKFSPPSFCSFYST